MRLPLLFLDTVTLRGSLRSYVVVHAILFDSFRGDAGIPAYQALEQCLKMLSRASDTLQPTGITIYTFVELEKLRGKKSAV